MSYKCLIIDDELPAINLIKNHLSMFDDFEIIGECHNAVKAFELIKKHPIDLIFLDIQMPILTGLEFLKSLQHPPKVIFTTAYREYAVEGYDLDIVDYLLKPISFSRFLKAIERFSLQMNSTKPIASTTQTIEESPDHLFVNINKKSHKVVFNELLYIESLKDYIRIHTFDNKLIVKSNIGKIYQQLPKNQFLRTHRSFIVNLSKLTAFTAHDIEIGGIEIPIGGSYKKEVLGKLKG